jgi:hypothetical protein
MSLRTQSCSLLTRQNRCVEIRAYINSRIYTAVLTQDLLEDWTVIQSWGGKHNQRGGGKVTQVPTFEDGIDMLRAITKVREKHGYRLI